MNETAVSDTGPLLHLDEIGQIALLDVFREILLTTYIKSELMRLAAYERIERVLSNRIVIEEIDASSIVNLQREFDNHKIQIPDISVAVLANRYKPSVVLTDDLELRKALEYKGVTVVGSIGILIRAYKLQRLTKNETQEFLDKLFNGSSLYLSREFFDRVKHFLENI